MTPKRLSQGPFRNEPMLTEPMSHNHFELTGPFGPLPMYSGVRMTISAAILHIIELLQGEQGSEQTCSSFFHVGLPNEDTQTQRQRLHWG